MHIHCHLFFSIVLLMINSVHMLLPTIVQTQTGKLLFFFKRYDYNCFWEFQLMAKTESTLWFCRNFVLNLRKYNQPNALVGVEPSTNVSRTTDDFTSKLIIISLILKTIHTLLHHYSALVCARYSTEILRLSYDFRKRK